jgi:hypothetical protein
MPAITQLTSNFLGGVSKQIDEKKLQGQVTECVNGYPDPTFGLLKRPGMKHISVLKDTNGDVIDQTTLADASWFFIDRSKAGSYIGCIKGANIYVWDENGTPCTIANSAGTYLTDYDVTTETEPSFHFRSIQDTTIITNKAVITAMQTAPTPTLNGVATIKLLGLDDSTYKVTIQGVDIEVNPKGQGNPGDPTFADMLVYDGSSNQHTAHHLADAIVVKIGTEQTANNADFSGKWYIEGYLNSLVIRRTAGTDAVITDGTAPTGNPVSFTISGNGGITNNYLEIFQNEVSDVSKLPLESRHGDVVKIQNTLAQEDDYYVKYEAYDSAYGAGYWTETVSPSASLGVNAGTMPHELVNTGPLTFTFGPIDYTPRKTGDDLTSPNPSFIGKKINSTFFYSDRFGVLSEDNVFLGVANDRKNLFVKSALVQTASDPIDLNVSSVRPVKLSDVLPSPQGLILFSAQQQYQLYTTDSAALTPTTAVIKSLSNYEMATDIAPKDVGTTPVFVTKVPGHTKLFTLALRDIEQPPVVVDISKTVLEWIPESVDGLTVSPPNSVVILSDRSTSYFYVYKYYNNGERDLFQSWVKWKIPGTIEAAEIINDTLFIVSQQAQEYTLESIALDELPSGTVVSTNDNFSGNACLDMATRPVSPDGGTTASVVWDETNDVTKIYVPYTPIANKEAAMLLTIPTADKGTDAELDSDQGYWAVATERTEIGTGYRYFEVKGNFADYADGIVVGYNYDFDVELPKFFVKLDQAKSISDYTATLTISRAKFSIGRSGVVRFEIKADGANEWKSIQTTIDANDYSGDTNPVTLEKIFTLPIHRRNTNFELKVTSNYPYPVSLVSMMWEGMYSPRFYRRS